MVGDLVEVDGVTGKVVKVGFRSTRIRTIDTSYMTIPNKNIVNNKMSNLARRTSRKVHFNMGLTYNITHEQLNNIVKQIKSYGENHPKKNEAVNVGVYNLTNLGIEISVEMHFNYETWDNYIKTRNEVLLEIMRIVKDNNAEFAYQIPLISAEKKS